MTRTVDATPVAEERAPAAMPAAVGGTGAGAAPEVVGGRAPLALLDLAAAWMDRWRWALLVAGLALYAAGYASHWRVSGDGADYLLIARSLAEGGGYVHPRGLHEAVPPGFPHLVAPVFAAFGSDAIWAVNIVQLVIGVANLALVFWLFRLHADRPTAVVVTMLVAACELFYIYCLEPMADLPFMTGLLLLLIGAERLYRARPARAGSVLLMAAGIAIMAVMRSVALVATAAVALGLAWELVRRRRWGLLAGLGGGALVVAAAALLAASDAGLSALRQDASIFGRLLTDDLGHTIRHTIPHNLFILFCETASRVAFGADFGAWVNLPFSVALILAALALARERPAWGLLVALFVAQWLIFIVDARYFLPLVPLVAYGWWRMGRGGECRFTRRGVRAVFVVLVGMWPALSLMRIGIEIGQQHHPRFLEVYQGGRYAGLDEIVRAAEERTPDDAVIATNSKLASPLTFRSRRRTEIDWTPMIEDAAALYALEPLPAPFEAALAEHGWRPGAMVAEVQRPEGWPPLVLRRMDGGGTSGLRD